MLSEEIAKGITLHCGDMREVLATLSDSSIDSCVTDPPYHLSNNTGSRSPDQGQYTPIGHPKSPKGGFMGKQWDGGDISFRPETWAEVYRVLKPGGHLLAFGGTRTYHRLACAVEDAGFEIRDCIQWLFGSGFPKSHDVAKDIDRRGGKQVQWFGCWLKQWREQNNIKQSDVAALFPSKTGKKTGCVANWELGFNLPTPEQFNLICARFGLPFDSLEAAEREVIGKGSKPKPTFHTADIGGNAESNVYNLTSPGTDAARQWAGWGTALKPAAELIVVARKPLIGTVVENVLAHGTGAINVDGCRIGESGASRKISTEQRNDSVGCYGDGLNGGGGERNLAFGRWPANVVLSMSEDEYELKPFTSSTEKRELFRWLSENA